MTAGAVQRELSLSTWPDPPPPDPPPRMRAADARAAPARGPAGRLAARPALDADRIVAAAAGHCPPAPAADRRGADGRPRRRRFRRRRRRTRITAPAAGGRGRRSGTGDGAGDGAGDGGTPPRHVRGRLRDSDYPRGLGEAGIEGTVSVRYAVAVDGRVSDCAIAHSSGSVVLDATTCRLIEQRFRLSPSRDAAGRRCVRSSSKTRAGSSTKTRPSRRPDQPGPMVIAAGSGARRGSVDSRCRPTAERGTR